MRSRNLTLFAPACAAVVAAAIAAVAGCGLWTERKGPPPNILLISIDALRADRLEAYGYRRPTSPFLAELGRSGLVFERAFVNTHGTTQSHTTILSGLYQQQHGVGLQDGAGVVRTVIPDGVELLPELLRARGYRTIGVTDAGNASAAFGFARGFDAFDDRGGGIWKGSQRVVRMVEKAGADAPIFVFLHTYEVHSPYRPRPRYRALFGVPAEVPPAMNPFLLEHAHAAAELEPGVVDSLSLLYDAEIRSADDALRGLFKRLEALGFMRNAVVVVTADHGEEFGEHGGLLHRDLLYDVLLHVPLILEGPGIAPGRPDQPVSSIDIAPTLLALASAPVPAEMEGSSLLETRRRSAVVAQYSTARYAIRTRDWKLIWTVPGTIELFDLRADPGELENVAALHPDMTATLEAALDRWRQRHQSSAPAGREVELSPEEWRKLEALGYVR
jgi:arylsulfatase A-like enzyme